LPAFESIALKNVEFRFDDEPAGSPGIESFALGPIDLQIGRGDVVCVVGGNGSGKTVLMRIIAGLYPVASGELLFNGKALAREDMEDYRDRFSTVFNDFFLFRDLLGRRDTSPSTVNRWLEYFGIAGKTTFANGRFSTVDLSTGQRKRLALIVALLDERPILLLDEFGAEQDPEHRDQFYRVWLPELRKMGITVLIVSHDDAYFESADMLVRMDYGKIVECRRREHHEGARRAANIAAL
jgi:putative ATP-binding cassette transporter